MRRLVVLFSAATLSLVGGVIATSAVASGSTPTTEPSSAATEAAAATEAPASTAGAAETTEAAVPSTATHPLVGAWQVANIYTITLMTFTGDGVVTEVDPLTSGVGVWEATGPNTAAVTLMVPITDAAGTNNGGAAVAQWRYSFDVNPDGQTAMVAWEAQVFINGEPTGDHFGPGSDIATRINVEELGAPWDSATSVPTTSN
jgi:hypothetical protein